jgi:hypothetical protein
VTGWSAGEARDSSVRTRDGQPVGPTPARVERMISSALHWVEGNLMRFDPVARAGSPDWFRSKASLELAVLCMHARRLPGGARPEIDACFAALERTWEQPVYQERAVREPGMVRLYAATYIALRGADRGDAYRRSIQWVVDDGYATAVEDVPFRLLEMRYLLELGGFRHTLPSERELYERTVLAKSPPILHFTNLDAYSVTHTLFYLADLGLKPISAITRDQRPRVLWTVARLLGLYLRRRDWDLVGELLLGCQCLRWAPHLLYAAAWDALLDAQLPDGSIPGPPPREPAGQRGGGDPADRLFEESYHTTLIGALAGLSLQPLLQTPSTG